VIKIKKTLSELRGVLGGYGFATPQAESSTKGSYPFADKQKQYRGYRDAELDYAAKDASDAMTAMKDHDPSAENWYRDDVSTIRQEIERRRGKKAKTEASTKVGDRATITGGNKKYVGKQGTISGVTGSEQPFHWQIKLDDGPEGVWKGDEFDASGLEKDEVRTPDARGSMASGRYIGQVLGNVISDIEKGRHEDAVGLLRKLKADLEKTGTEVIELWGGKN
jgi:hypothetical protein